MTIKITPDTDPIDREDWDNKGIVHEIGFENTSMAFGAWLMGYMYCSDYKSNRILNFLTAEGLLFKRPYIAKSSIRLKIGIRSYNGQIMQLLNEGKEELLKEYQVFLNKQKTNENGNT